MTNNLIHSNPDKRCLAKTRRGSLCQTLRVTGKKRCRMHGGAKGSGAPYGNQNALKHGMRSREAIENRKYTNSLIRQYKAFSKEMELG